MVVEKVTTLLKQGSANFCNALKLVGYKFLSPVRKLLKSLDSTTEKMEKWLLSKTTF